MTTTDHIHAIEVTARLLRTEHERRVAAERDLATERLAHAAARRDLDAAIARAEAAERGAVAPTAAGDTTEDKANLAAYLAAWNARTDSQHLHGVRAVATAAVERHRLTPERLASALEAHGHGGLTRKVYAHLAPATVPPGIVAEQLAIARNRAWCAQLGRIAMPWERLSEEHRKSETEAMQAALDSLARRQPAPPAPEAPRYVVMDIDGVPPGTPPQHVALVPNRSQGEWYVRKLQEGKLRDTLTWSDVLTRKSAPSYTAAIVDTCPEADRG